MALAPALALVLATPSTGFASGPRLASKTAVAAHEAQPSATPGPTTSAPNSAAHRVAVRTDLALPEGSDRDLLEAQILDETTRALRTRAIVHDDTSELAVVVTVRAHGSTFGSYQVSTTSERAGRPVMTAVERVCEACSKTEVVALVLADLDAALAPLTATPAPDASPTAADRGPAPTPNAAPIAVAPIAPSPDRPKLAAGIALLSLGVVGVATGGTLWGVNGDVESRSRERLYERCRDMPDADCDVDHKTSTFVPGVVVLAVSSAVLITGAALLGVALHRKRAAKSPRVSASASPHAAMLFVQGRF